MKMLKWQRYLEDQRQTHGKLVFTITELAHVSGSSRRVLNVELNRLCKNGIIARYARGLYGLPGVLTPQILLPAMDSHAYLTSDYALQYHGLITQNITTMTCFTDKRNPRSRERTTPLGRFVFVCVSGFRYNRPDEGVIADPEQALCDYLYLMRRRGVRPESQVTFRNLQMLSDSRLDELLGRYPGTVGKDLKSLVNFGKTERSQ